MSILEYKGYFGSVLFSEADAVFHGKLEFIRDLITFESDNAKDLVPAFQDAVDDYLALCESEGKKPDSPLKGSFNVRPGRELHRRAALYAQQNDTSLNAVVSEALRFHLDRIETSA